MEQEISQLVQAIAIASDPTQAALHQQALGYINTLQQNASTTWRLALTLFVDRNPEGTPKYSVQTRFFALRVLDDFFDNRFEPLDSESFQTIQQALVSYIQSEYVRGSAEADATFLRNKFSHTLTLFFLCAYIDQWPTFFTDLFTLIRPESLSGAAFNHHISLLFFHIVLEISGEVADQMIKSARAFNQARHNRDGRVRDAVRERDAARINEAVLTIIAEAAERMATLRKQDQTSEVTRELNANIEVADWGIRTFGSYVGWIDINLTITPTTVPLLFGLLADSSLPIRLATSLSLLRIVAKGLKEPTDKLQLLKVLSLGQVLDALESKTRTQQIERGSDIDEGEESYREALGKLFNAYGQELAKLVDECPNEAVRSEASTYLAQALPIMLRFMADEYDDTSNTVFPLLQVILSGYKRQRKTSSEPIDESKRSFLTSLLEVILTKMKWDEEADLDDPEEDDNAEFERLRAELRSFLDSILIVDQDLVINAIRTLSLNTIAAYTNKVNMKWNDAELGIFLVYLFGEINKSGGRGRSAFCHAPAVEKDKRKEADYSEYPLTPHGEMLVALVQSGIAGYPHRAVALQFFETVARYPDFFKVRKECIIPVLEAMIDSRGLHNESQAYRSRLAYLFHRFIKTERNDIPPDIAANILGSIRDLLSVRVKLPELDDPESDLLTEAAKSPELDSQLYLFETAGVLTSLLYRTPQQQSTILLELVKPLLDDLSVALPEAKKGGEDVLPIVKVHHLVMALGSIAKGFPDFPAVPAPDYIFPPLDIFAQMAQAIIVCLEAMNVWRVIRDATRAAFARIMATAGPSVTHFIPVLMDNLLAHFQPSELVDFMNFIGLLIHKLPSDMFDVLDRLNGPLYAHINALISQPASGTDDQRSQVDTKRAYLGLLNNVFTAKLQRAFTSERNYAQFEALLGLLLRILEDTSDPPSQKSTLLFFQRSVSAWGQLPDQLPVDGAEGNTGLPGFERFIYERLVPALFRVPSLPGFNIKDGQMTVVLHETANLLQSIYKTRGQEAHDYFLTLFLPSQNWPQEAALDFTTKLRTLDGKNFRKYFTDVVRSSQAPS
ncbi:ARM repeat-containing protein [Pluteus cervinus]|uniref:ARM repeat-containing protein n=1 Tax=Pluteus cervinus TaxID=181527 RepID=A0ACD3B5F4_9AGAR|nr:ARM repeat-containing protein [Pluteus cervinus]